MRFPKRQRVAQNNQYVQILQSLRGNNTEIKSQSQNNAFFVVAKTGNFILLTFSENVLIIITSFNIRFKKKRSRYKHKSIVVFELSIEN